MTERLPEHSASLMTEFTRLCARDFVTSLYPRSTGAFDNIWLVVPYDSALSVILHLFRQGAEPWKSARGLTRVSQHEDVASATWSVLSVMFRFQEHLTRVIGSGQKSLTTTEIDKMLEQCMVAAKTPGWLRPRIKTLMPGLINKAASGLGLLPLEGGQEDVYIKFVGKRGPFTLTGEELRNHRKQPRVTDFDLYMDDIPPNEQLFVRGRPMGIRKGEFLPYRVLRFLLTRVGRDVRYSELRTYLWTPAQLQSTQHTGRLIYEALERIRNVVSSSLEKSETQGLPWFQRSDVRGRIHVSEKLRTCLLTSSSSLPREFE